jgi:hypothetical protein
MDMSITQASDHLFRPDMDKAKLTYRRMNLTYRHTMRGTVCIGDAEKNHDYLFFEVLLA